MSECARRHSQLEAIGRIEEQENPTRRNAQDDAHTRRRLGGSKEKKDQRVGTRETVLTPGGDWENRKE